MIRIVITQTAFDATLRVGDVGSVPAPAVVPISG
jgi:hypothetical protein